MPCVLDRPRVTCHRNRIVLVTYGGTTNLALLA
jgi:hypothetical protein